MHPKAVENGLEMTGYCYEVDDIFLTSRASHQKSELSHLFFVLENLSRNLRNVTSHFP